MPLPIFKKNEVKKPQIKNIVAIAAGKGGVGKSLVTVNIALALKELGYNVGVLDADLYGPSLRQMLPEDRLPTQQGDRIVPALSFGIKMISLAYFKSSHEAAAVRAPIANGLINQFVNQVEWGDLDYLLIDFPPGTGDIQLTLSQKASLNGAVIVTTPQEVAVLDVRKAMNLFDQVKIPLIGLVENMSYYLHNSQEKVFLFGQGGGERLAQEWGIPLIGQIPVDPRLCSVSDKGESLFTKPGHNDLIELFTSMAKKLVGHLDLLREEKGSVLDQFELNWEKK